ERDSKSRRNDEGKGEVETLNGKLHSVKMGDKLRSVGNNIDMNRKRNRSEDVETEEFPKEKVFKANKAKSQGVSILNQTDDLGMFRYVPKTRQTRLVYEEFLRLVQGLLGNQPQDVLKDATD